MSLSDELRELEQKRTEEIRTLHYTYLRTKREVTRAVSPTRLVRKHLSLSLAAAAAAGMLLAPRPTPRTGVSQKATERAVRKAHRQQAISLSWFKKLLNKFLPDAAQFIPDTSDFAKVEEAIHDEAEKIRDEAKAEAKKPKSKGTLLKLLEALLPMIASKVDWRTLANQLMHNVYQKMQQPAQGSEAGSSHHEPHVSVADAGTIKPHDFENFD